MDETCIVEARIDDGKSVEVFSYTKDGIELKQKICRGTLKTGGIVEDEIDICKGYVHITLIPAPLLTPLHH